MLHTYHFFEYLTSHFEYQSYETKSRLHSSSEDILPEKMDLFLSGLETHLHDEVILILPRSFFIEKKMTLPFGTEAEILQMTQMQILKMLPFSENEILAYPFKIEKKEDNFCSVLVYVLLKSALQELLPPFISSRKPPHRIIPSHLRTPFYTGEATDSEEQPRFYVLCKKDAFELSVCHPDGQFIFSRTVELTDPEEKNPFEEVRQSLDYAEKKYALPPNCKCLFVSMNPLPPDWTREVEGMPQAEIKSLSPGESVKIMAENLKSISFPMDSVVHKNKKRIRFTSVFRALFILFIALAGIGGYMFMTETGLQNELSSVKARLQKTRVQAEEALRLKKQMDLIASHTRGNILTLKIISELYDLIPSYIHITMLQIKSTSQIILKGVTRQGMMEIMGKIENSPLFENASLLYQNKLNNEEGMEFHISAEIEEVS